MKPDYCTVGLKAENSEDAIGKLAAELVRLGAADEGFAADVIAREGEFPTGLPIPGVGFAMPHAKSEHAKRDAVAFAKLAYPVTFSSMEMDGSELKVEFVMLLTVIDPKKHLECLQAVLAALQEAGVQEGLGAAQSEADLLAVLEHIAA